MTERPTPQETPKNNEDEKVSNTSFLAKLIEAIKKMEQDANASAKAKNDVKQKSKEWVNKLKSKQKRYNKEAQVEIKKEVEDIKKEAAKQRVKGGSEADPKSGKTVVEQYRELVQEIRTSFADEKRDLPKEKIYPSHEMPQVLYRETMKVYVGVDWNSLTNEDAIALKHEIVSTLKSLRTEYPSFYNKAEPKAGNEAGVDDDVQIDNLLQMADPRIDVYRTKRLKNTDGVVDKKLQELQQEIDLNSKTIDDEESLLDVYNKLTEILPKKDFNSENYIDNESEEFILNTQWELQDQRAIARANKNESPENLDTPQNNNEVHTPEPSVVENGDLPVENLRTEPVDQGVKSEKNNKDYQEIVDLEINESIQNSILKIKNPQLRQALLKYFQKKNRSIEDSFNELAEIKKIFFEENQQEYLSAITDPAKTFASDEERDAQLGVDFRADKDLFVHKIASEVVKQFTKDGRFNRREGFWTPENMHHMQNFDVVDFFPKRNADGVIPFSQGLLQLDSMLWKIISPPTLNHNDTYRLNLDQEIDAQVFFQFLQTRLPILGLNPDQVDQVIQRYQTLKDVKEAAHNFSYIANVGNAEMLAKHIMNLDAAKADFMLQNFEFVGAAISARESALLAILANNGGYIPSEFFGKDSRMFSQWENLSKNILKTSIYVQRPGFEEFGESDFQVKMAMEMSQLLMIGTQMLPRIIADAKPAKDFRSEPMRGLATNMGFFDLIVNKFHSGGLGFAGLHTIITGEEHSPEEAMGWDVDRFIEWLNAEQDDPVIGMRLIDFKNLFGQSDLYGPNSRWKERALSGEMSSEEYHSRGFAVKLADSRARMTEVAHREFFKKHHITSKAEEAKFIQKHQHDIEHRVRELVIEDAKKIFGEVLDRTPLAIAHHWSKENGSYGEDPTIGKLHWTRRRFDVTESVLGDDIKILLAQLSGVRIKEYDKKTGEVVERKIGSVYDLYKYNPLTYQPENEEFRLSTKDRDLVANIWSQVTNKINELETNLAAIQQALVTKGQETDKLDNYFVLIKDSKGREQVKKYVSAIRLAANPDYGTNKPVSHNSYIHKLAEDVAEGRMRRLMNMTDRKYENDHFSVAGPDVFQRVLNDNSNQTQAAKGASEWLANILNSQTYGKSTEEKLLFLVNLYKEKVFLPMFSVDPRLAQETSFYLWNAMLALKVEDPWVAYSGIFGDIYKVVAPQSLQPSFERRTLGKDVGESLTPNHINSLMHMLVASGILNKSDNMPYKYGAGHEYSEHALAKKWGGRARNVYAEMFMYVGPLVVFYTLFQAIKKAIEGEEEGKKHH